MKKEISNLKAWGIWGIAALFYLYEMLLRVSPSVMTNEIMISYNITSTMLGVLVSFYYYSYTLLQIPCGIILDKIGPKYLLAGSAVMCALGSSMFAGSSEIYIAEIGRFFVGAGSACAFISCLQIASSLFPIRYFPIVAGATNMMGTLGGLFGGLPVAKLVNATDWKTATLYLAAFGAIVLILILILVPARILKPEDVHQKPIFQSMKEIVTNKQVIMSGAVAGFMYLPISAFSELWAVPFFMQKYNITNETASIASAILFVGVAIGSVTLAIVARLLRGYMKTIKLSTIITAFLFVPLIYCDISLSASFVIVFIIGLSTGAQVLNFTCAKNNVSKDVAGTTLAATNGIVMLIGSIFQPVLGLFLDIFWNGQMSEDGLRIYDTLCYQHSILALPICLMLAFFIAAFIKETIHTEKT